MSYTYSSVQSVIDKVSQDARLQLSSLPDTAGQPILLDFCDRINKQMLRFSRWDFQKSDTMYFITRKGITKYWIGPKGAQPGECVDTQLNLIDVGRLDLQSVYDISNLSPLNPQQAEPIGPNLVTRSGQTRPGLPKVVWWDNTKPNLIKIFPGALNDNPWQPSPDCPILSTVPGGTLPQRTYNALITFTDSLGGESMPSSTSIQMTMQANFLCSIQSPTLDILGNDSGVLYNGYNVYLGEGGEGSESLQNAIPIPLGQPFTEPTSGLIAGVTYPTQSTIQQLGGYIIKFRYYKTRLKMSDVEQMVQIPDDYIDIMVQGINALVWKFLGRLDDAQGSASLYRKGLTEMVWDKNQRPGTQFIRPDYATYVNQQLLGFLPDTGEF